MVVHNCWLTVALDCLVQKAVRRQGPDAAIRCAAALAFSKWPAGVGELARRLVVVAVEVPCLTH